MLRRVDEQQGREVIGQKGSRDCAGILFTYYLPDEPGPVNYRVRRDRPDVEQGKDGERGPGESTWERRARKIVSISRRE